MLDTEFDSEEIEKAFPKYGFLKSLGRGAFGKVFLVRDRQTQEKLAVKKISCFGMCEYQRNNAINQVRLLASIDHLNVIKFQSGLFDSNEDDLYLFMQYASEGDLAHLIEQAKSKKKRIAEQKIWSIVLQIADALQYLHKNNIIHRDIKPANIFQTSKQVYKLGDLNVSKILANGDFAKTKTGSPLYTCPQVWNKQQGYNEKCDIWSLGVVAYELASLKVPYEANSIEELVRKQKTARPKSISGYTNTLNQLILQMLQYFPKRRISAERVKTICMKALKMEQEDNLIPLDPLMQTIVIPESEQRWINLVPLPPKAKKQQPSINEKKGSKDKYQADLMPNRSNILIAHQNKSLLIPKSKSSYEKPVRVRLPSIQRKETLNTSQVRLIVPQRSREKSRDITREKSRDITREKSLQKSRDKSRRNTLSTQTPQKKEVFSSRILRKN